MPNPKCEVCQKTAYPLESVTALEKTYHKACFKCVVCKGTLNLKNFKGYEGQIYCLTHTPKPKATSVTDSVMQKAALNAPKRAAEGLGGAHKGARELAPTSTGDFSVNNSSVDQSTENAPEESGITYEARSGDQSTENAPEESGISYEASHGDQSTENAPEESGITYDQAAYDQSTESHEQHEQQPEYTEQEQYEYEQQQHEHQEQQ